MTVGQRLPEVLEAPNGRKWSVRPGRRNGVLVATSGDARMFADSLEQLRHLVATRSGGERRW